jgi:hypothetical protein
VRPEGPRSELPPLDSKPPWDHAPPLKLDRRTDPAEATSGITKIDGWQTSDGRHHYVISGEVRAPLAGPDRFGGDAPEVPGSDRAHLWGRDVGSEAAAGIMDAPRGYDLASRMFLQEGLDAARQGLHPGNHLRLEAAATSQPVNQHGGREVLESARYRVTEVDRQGRVVGTPVDLTFTTRPDGSAGVHRNNRR